LAIPSTSENSEMTRGVKMGLKKEDFPYESMSAAAKDGFKALGGPDQAFGCMTTGWQQKGYRKQYNMRRDALIERAKAAGLDKASNQ
jgi:hypothetical protein